MEREREREIVRKTICKIIIEADNVSRRVSVCVEGHLCYRIRMLLLAKILILSGKVLQLNE